jgi:hypothetical protein
MSFISLRIPWDVLFQEATTAREALVPALAGFLTAVQQIEATLLNITERETQEHADPLDLAEASVQQAIQQRFESRRHFEHLSALFATLRRRNLLGRLMVAQAALELAQALLEDPENIWQDFLQTTDLTEAQLQHLAALEQEASPRDAPSPKEAEEDENIRGSRGSLTPLIGSVAQARRHLSAFEQRLPELRTHLPRRTGRIEIFYVRKKTSFLPEVLALRKAIRRALRTGTPLEQIDPRLIAAVHPQVAEHFLAMGLHMPIPKHLEEAAYHFKTFGPYGKLRIKGITATKGTRHGPNYAISFGPKDRAPGYVLARHFS